MQMLPAAHHPLKTKRLVIGQISMCRGCCCGATERGKPEVPVEWLKCEWRRRGLMKNIQLTISGCLGPCDLSNVVAASGSSGSVWLGNIRHLHQYQALVDWASQSKVAGKLLPLPEEFADLRFDPYRAADYDTTAWPGLWLRAAELFTAGLPWGEGGERSEPGEGLLPLD